MRSELQQNRRRLMRSVVLSQNLNPDVLMMDSAKDWYRCDTADLLGPVEIRSIFVQREMRPDTWIMENGPSCSGSVEPEASNKDTSILKIPSAEHLAVWRTIAPCQGPVRCS
jgi:hypothetical protein